MPGKNVIGRCANSATNCKLYSSIAVSVDYSQTQTSPAGSGDACCSTAYDLEVSGSNVIEQTDNVEGGAFNTFSAIFTCCGRTPTFIFHNDPDPTTDLGTGTATYSATPDGACDPGDDCGSCASGSCPATMRKIEVLIEQVMPDISFQITVSFSIYGGSQNLFHPLFCQCNSADTPNGGSSITSDPIALADLIGSHSFTFTNDDDPNFTETISATVDIT